MNTAIIAEYNPFHKGHMYHIEQTKKINGGNIIAVMSGNFVQRGEPALVNKYVRARSALLNGVDMVLELPSEYASSAADVFAFGACDIIKKSGIIDSVSFGCESGNTEDFIKIAKLLNNESTEFKNILKSELSKGISYPAARSNAVAEYLNTDTSFMNSPNNILALEYIRNILDTSIKPLAIKRIASDYNSDEITGEISSASAIRKALINNEKAAYSAIPQNTIELIAKEHIHTLDDYSDILHYILRTKENIADTADITEGLDNRIISLASGQKISELTEAVKTKRYTYSKIKRAILHIILDIKKSNQNMTGVKYIRVLGIRKDSINLLSELCQKSELPVVTSVSDNKHLMQNEIRATDIYNIRGNAGEEYRSPLVIV